MVRVAAAVAALAGVLLSFLPLFPMAAQGAPSDAEELARLYLRALNQRDGRLLASLYTHAPHIVCNDLDVLTYNEVEDADLDGTGLRLARLTKSEAKLSDPPGRVLYREGYVVIYIEWRYSRDSEEGFLKLEITWELEPSGGGYMIGAQSTKDLLDDSGCG